MLDKKTDFIQAHCIMGAPVCSIQTEERFSVAFINNILGGPFMNSRLNLAIREKYGFCYSIYSDVQFFRDSGVLTINFATEKKYIHKTAELVKQELDKLINKGISLSQHKTALKQIAGQIDLSWDNAAGLVTSLGNALLDTGTILTRKQIYECYQSLSPTDIKNTALKYFNPEQQSIYRYIPEG
jgi:predicted Zn-dependent peptidase